MATRRKKKTSKKAECRVVRMSAGKRKMVSKGSAAQCRRIKRELEKKDKKAAYFIEEC